MLKKTRVLTVSDETTKTKKIMRDKWNPAFKNEICVEVNAMDEEGTEIIIRKVVGDIGIHETYMNIYNKLMNMSENVKWEIHYVRSRSINSIYNNETKGKEV